MDKQQARSRLEEISQEIDRGQYRRGRWQGLLRDAAELDPADRHELADDISRVSRKLHRRHGFVAVSFAAALIVEVVLLVTGSVLIVNEGVLARLAGAVLLALCLQPLIKVLVGTLLGVRYDYAYLWYVEPRFKMAYGSYFRLSPVSRVIVHLAGSIGTPLATLIAFVAFADDGPVLLAWIWLLAFVGAVVLQVGAFLAEWFGVRMVGPFRLSTLTSPATAAQELKIYLGRE